MGRLLYAAVFLFTFLFLARVVWNVWLKGYLTKEGIINGDKTEQSTEPPTTSGE